MTSSAKRPKPVNKALRADHIATGVLYGVAGFFLALLAAFTIYILIRGGRAAAILSNQPGTSIAGQLFNTIYLVVFSLAISTPIGICAGIYMAEYMPTGKLSGFIRTCIETLSSLPSIVVGLFGYLVFLVMTHSTYNLVAGALAVSILNLPLVTTTTEDALRAIPKYYKEGSLGIGATHWQTIAKVLVPAAIPRIVTGIILAGGRAFGEAAALLYIVGTGTDVNFRNWNPTSPMSPLNPFRSSETLAMHIWDMNTNPSVPHAHEQADFSAAILIIMVFIFSLGARFIGAALERKMTGNKQ